MSLVVLESMGLNFGARAIFDAVNLRIDRGHRIGLVGPNGSGKTTLLKIMAGEQSIDRGQVVSASGVRIGYLPQDLTVDGGISLRDLVLSSVPGRADLEDRLAATQAELEEKSSAPDRDDAELLSLAAEVSELHERALHFERFFAEHEALRILAGLGFSPGDELRDVGELSGGWRMRAVLAALLFQKPDLTLFDEPTNHLDLPSVAWFADFLKRSQTAFVLISHDRDFLNEQINRVVSLEVEGVRNYPGDYDRYVKQRAEEEELLENRAKNLERERERIESFVTRFRAQANKAKAVQSRVKALEKMDDVEVFRKRRVARFTFAPVGRTVNEVVRVEKLAKAYGNLGVFDDVNLQVARGDKIAIIGSNGAGKTTLLKIIAGELEQTGGTVRIGSGVEVGYYAQHHADTLDRAYSAYDSVLHANPDATPNQIRSVLGAFLFSGDDVDKRVSVLSGGERARVALARLLIKPGHLILMDEPTNHLDLDTSESLTKSLAGFGGTLIFVSHNRSLIRGLATQIWNIEKGSLEAYGGTLDEYLYSCAQRAQADDAAVGASAAWVDEPSSAAPAKRSREDAKVRKRREADARKLRKEIVGDVEDRIQTIEERITKLELTQKERSELLADPSVYEDAGRRNGLLNQFQKGADKLEELNARWEGLALQLEEAEKSFAAKLSESGDARE